MIFDNLNTVKILITSKIFILEWVVFGEQKENFGIVDGLIYNIVGYSGGNNKTRLMKKYVQDKLVMLK